MRWPYTVDEMFQPYDEAVVAHPAIFLTTVDCPHRPTIGKFFFHAFSSVNNHWRNV